jgi:hypothetical protein
VAGTPGLPGSLHSSNTPLVLGSVGSLHTPNTPLVLGSVGSLHVGDVFGAPIINGVPLLHGVGCTQGSGNVAQMMVSRHVPHSPGVGR